VFGLRRETLAYSSVVQGTTETPFYPILDSELGVCYQFKPESKLKVKTVGGNAIHKVAIRTMQEKAGFMGDAEYEGTAITIHGEGDLAKVGGKTVFIPPGYTAAIAIRQTEINRLEFPHFDLSHFEQTERERGKGNGEKRYCVPNGVPKDLCEFERTYIYLARQCKCRNIYMSDYIINTAMVDTELETFARNKKLEGIGACSSKAEWQCIVIKEAFARGHLDEILNSSTFPLNHYDRMSEWERVEETARGNHNCMQTPCHETKYEVRLTGLMPVTASYTAAIQQDLRTMESDPDLANATIVNGGDGGAQISSVNIFFDDLKVLRYTQTPSFSSASLVGGIGGYFGLFLGISVLTVIEFMELLYVLSLGLHKKAAKANGDAGSKLL